MNRVTVQPELLRWARDRARMGYEALAPHFPQLDAWESGAVHPTLKQLEDFANRTHTPVGYFFLRKPPEEPIPIPDFRTIANQPIARPSPDLLDTIYICQQRQDWYRDFAKSIGEAPVDFIGSAQTTDDVVPIASSIRQALKFDLNDRRLISTWTDALRYFIGEAEELGILVMVNGVVGSNNRRKLDPDEFRGFALVDDLAPLVFINGSDTKAGQIFTLAHELAHIWLGQSGISDTQARTFPDRTTERWCNHLAAELLVPLQAFEQEYKPGSILSDEITRLAKLFKVSALVILRRVYDAGGLDREAFWQAYDKELKRLRAIPKGRGGDFYSMLGSRSSRTFTRALVISTLEGQTPFNEAFRLLGFRKMSTFRDVGQKLGVSF